MVQRLKGDGVKRRDGTLKNQMRAGKSGKVLLISMLRRFCLAFFTRYNRNEKCIGLLDYNTRYSLQF